MRIIYKVVKEVIDVVQENKEGKNIKASFQKLGPFSFRGKKTQTKKD